jgi:glucose/arabinose dehydrogenase
VNLTVDVTIPGFSQPLFVTHAGDKSGRIFVVEQGGLVRVVKDGKLQDEPFLDASRLLGRVGGEQGLLGLAFHPKFAENGRLFIAYTNQNKDDAVSELVASPDRRKVDVATLRPLFAVDDFAGNHNGGMLAFGPDGKLYIGTGDGGGANDPQRTAQDDKRLLGKMLVLDVDGPNASTPTIWAKGLRNPWRYAFDRATGDLWIGDVGQNRYEMVYVARKARLADKNVNFGWSVVEGAHCFRPEEGCSAKGFEPVVMEYAHGADGCSITGGAVYRGKAFPALVGTYVVGDYCSGRVWTISNDGAKVALALESGVNISSFGEDEDGELWLCDHNGGTIRRIAVKR